MQKPSPHTPPPALPLGKVDLQDTPAQPPPEKEKVSIAIKGSAGKGKGSPKITAKGKGALAEQILDLAFQQGVKVRTDADLAEILSHLDVDSEIPLEALAAVATILNYVYKEQQRTENPRRIEDNLEQKVAQPMGRYSDSIIENT